MTIIFKGFGLIDKVPEEIWTEVHNTVDEAMTEAMLKKKKKGFTMKDHHEQS